MTLDSSAEFPVTVPWQPYRLLDEWALAVSPLFF
jgi:hypothetical protein